MKLAISASLFDAGRDREEIFSKSNHATGKDMIVSLREKRRRRRYDCLIIDSIKETWNSICEALWV